LEEAHNWAWEPSLEGVHSLGEGPLLAEAHSWALAFLVSSEGRSLALVELASEEGRSLELVELASEEGHSLAGEREENRTLKAEAWPVPPEGQTLACSRWVRGWQTWKTTTAASAAAAGEDISGCWPAAVWAWVCWIGRRR